MTVRGDVDPIREAATGILEGVGIFVAGEDFWACAARGELGEACEERLGEGLGDEEEPPGIKRLFIASMASSVGLGLPVGVLVYLIGLTLPLFLSGLIVPSGLTDRA
jgi:hypothetical protein